MYTVFVIAAIVLCVIALIVTLMVAKAESKKVESYGREGNSPASRLQRSEEYERRSLKENLPLLGIIYAVTFLIVLVIMLIFLFG